MTDDQLSIAPKTTIQEDLTTAGQRRINLIWEFTQAIIAIMVIVSNMIVAVYAGLTPAIAHSKFPAVLSNTLFLVVGFYFSRTNHAAIGGIGLKPSDEYKGR